MQWGDMVMCTGYPVVMVVVVAIETATTKADATIPIIVVEDDMVFACCISVCKEIDKKISRNNFDSK